MIETSYILGRKWVKNALLASNFSLSEPLLAQTSPIATTSGMLSASVPCGPPFNSLFRSGSWLAAPLSPTGLGTIGWGNDKLQTSVACDDPLDSESVEGDRWECLFVFGRCTGGPGIAAKFDTILCHCLPPGRSLSLGWAPR